MAEDLFDRVLCLPSGTAMSNGDLDRIIETIKNVSRRGAKRIEGTEVRNQKSEVRNLKSEI